LKFSKLSLRFLLAFLLVLTCAAQTQPAGPEGSWQGTLGAGSVKLRVVLTLTQTAPGEFKGVLDSLDQGATIPADKVTLTGDKLRVDFARVNGFYEGVVGKDGAEITGTWTQNNTAQPLSFKRAEASATAAPVTPKAAPPTDAKPSAPAKPFSSPVDVTVPVAPIAFHADGRIHLSYELHIANFAGSGISLEHIDVIDGSGTVLTAVDRSDLVSNILLPGNRQAVGMDKLNVGSGQLAVVYMWVTLDSGTPVPSAIEHRLTVRSAKFPDEIVTKCARLQVGQYVPVIGAPLRGDNWLAGNGPSNTSGHRRALVPVDGHAAIAQRFAIDWVRIYPDEKTFKGDPLDNKSYRSYGVEALAVADGTVTEVKDGIPENIPGEDSRAVPITMETVGGNHVVLDIGHGRYAFYAHLQPGSPRVKVGDHVKRGQVLGLVGNSGNSTEPHLHFHISDGTSPLGSEGMPYALETFEARPKISAPATKHHMEIPTESEIVVFSEK